ncbi:hypothetical protein Dda_5274 [Drechslerella dactyloides]|uniref:DUF4215 domain-containing protein n=1 Tax=Drechslerella dactyloides TaxID=74499 RepID=A0AAD6J015_DREDA|nr:hypothetical protein Dda_5274 [Drechslerella dactyloides]
MKVASFLATVFIGAIGAAAVDELLFHYDFTGYEDFVASGGYSYDPYPYNWTYTTVTEEEWNAMSTADFKQYKAIIIGDPVSTDPEDLDIIANNRKTWGPAIEGNVILIGTDTSNHRSRSQELMTNGIAFAATGRGTGLYFSLSKYYGDRNKTSVPILDIFGTFEVRGDLNSEQLENCYDNVHIVAESPVLTNITDKVLSNWSCSVHEAFVTYPSTGSQSFVPLAIAQDVPGEGSRSFSDGTNGIPYVLVRGASPIGCGNGRLDPGEECDDGNTRDGDGCNSACRFENGAAQGQKSAAGPVVGGVLGGVVAAAALAGLGFLAVTKTVWGSKAAAAVGISTAGGAGGGGASGATGATGAMYVPTGMEGKAAAAVAGYVPTGLEGKAAATAAGYVPGVTEKAAASVAHSAGQAAHGAAQATQGLAAIPPPTDGGATAAASSAFAPPIADPTGGAAAASAAAHGAETALTSAAAGAGTGAGTGTGTAMAGGAASAGAMGPAAGVSSIGTMAPTAGASAVGGTTAAFAPPAATGGGLSAGGVAGTSLAAGFVGTFTALFGRRKKNNNQSGMPVPPMAPIDPSTQYYPQQGYPLPQQPEQVYYPNAPPIPLPMSGFDEKEIKTSEAGFSGGLSVGIQEVVPTPSPQSRADPLGGDKIMPVVDQPYIPPPLTTSRYNDKAIDAGEIPPAITINTSVQESVYAPTPGERVSPVSPIVEMPVIPPPPPS